MTTESHASLLSARAAPPLLALTLLMGVLPRTLASIGIDVSTIGTVCFVITLAGCLLGFLTGRFRLFWPSWAIAAIITFGLFGMAGPLASLFVLPSLVAR